MTPLEVAEAICSQPTAPLLEQCTASAVRRIATDAGLPVSSDEAGNLVVGRGAELVMCAHLDHPAFHVVDGALVFKGGVRVGVAEVGSPLVFHRIGVAEPVGRGLLSRVDESARLAGGTFDLTDGDPGDYAVWDVVPWACDGTTITARACDDLLGVAAGLSALIASGDQHARLVCTRAEEIGLLGAAEAIRLQSIPSSATVLSLECSKALPGAPQGGGVIVRVGDRSTIFDPAVTAAVAARAATVEGLVWQRRLMDGGSCEATVLCAAGIAASGLALPLGGYHNQPDDESESGPVPETVLVTDYEAEVALLTSLCADPEVPDRGAGAAMVAATGAKARDLLAAHPLDR